MANPATERTFTRSYSASSMKSRLLNAFARRASEPSIETPAAEIERPINGVIKQFSESPEPTQSTPKKSKKAMLSELAAAQDEASRLRIDRDHWRARSVRRDEQLNIAERQLREQSHTIDSLTTTNQDLDRRVSDALYTANTYMVRHVAAVKDLNESERRFLKLKRSDRAKGRHSSTYLRLKALARGHKCGGTEGREQALSAALGVAMDRIEELETAGERLLDALDDPSSVGGEDDGGEDEDGWEDTGGLLDAELVFRGVLENDTYREQKALWGDLVDG